MTRMIHALIMNIAYIVIALHQAARVAADTFNQHGLLWFAKVASGCVALMIWNHRGHIYTSYL